MNVRDTEKAERRRTNLGAETKVGLKQRIQRMKDNYRHHYHTPADRETAEAWRARCDIERAKLYLRDWDNLPIV